MPIFAVESFYGCNNDANGHIYPHQRQNCNAYEDWNGDDADNDPDDARNFEIHNFFTMKIDPPAFVLTNHPHDQRKDERCKKLR